jgi:hypothetical protein
MGKTNVISRHTNLRDFGHEEEYLVRRAWIRTQLPYFTFLRGLLNFILYFICGKSSVHNFLKEISEYIFLPRLIIVQRLGPPFRNVNNCEISVAAHTIGLSVIGCKMLP